MRIEKINENQIRCTLNQKDLKEREIEISELAYGSAKAKALFQDLIQQASYEFGFDAEDIPLMIEAIPLLPEALILLVTKVEDPAELDTRFSNFTLEEDWDDENDSYGFSAEDFSQDSTDSALLDANPSWKIHDIDEEQTTDSYEEEKEPDFISLPETLGMQPRPTQNILPSKTDSEAISIFAFTNLDIVIQAAKHTAHLYTEKSTLYKDEKNHLFYLVLHHTTNETTKWKRLCNVLQEYGTPEKKSQFLPYYFEEHFATVIPKNALQILSAI